MPQQKNKQTTPTDEALITGALLIALGLLANEWFLTKILSPDGSAGQAALNTIRVFQAAILLPGATLILFRKTFNTLTEKGRLPLWRYAILKSAQVFFILMLLELASVTLVKRNENAVADTIGDYVKFDQTLGYTPIPNKTSTHRKTANGKILFDTTYTTDEYGRRVLSNITKGEDRSHHALLFGGSFTFGHGLPDDQTLAYHLAQESEILRPYAYAAPGYGTQQMLVHLTSEGFKDQIDQFEGVCIYVYIPDHVRRAIGSMRHINSFTSHFPRFILDDAGNIELTGSFARSRPTLLRIYRAMDYEYISKIAGLDIPFRIRESHMDITAKIIAEARDTYELLFDNSNFVVLLWPVAPTTEFDVRRIIPWLEREGISYLDYSALIDTNNAKYMLDARYDPHPSEKAHIAVAQALARDLDRIMSTPQTP